jgi:hypothetical protein
MAVNLHVLAVRARCGATVDIAPASHDGVGLEVADDGGGIGGGRKTEFDGLHALGCFAFGDAVGVFEAELGRYWEWWRGGFDVGQPGKERGFISMLRVAVDDDAVLDFLELLARWWSS